MKIIAALDPRTNAAAIEKILRHTGLWRDPPPRAPPTKTTEESAVDHNTPFTRPDILKSQIRNPESTITPAAASQPELFYITDEDCQAFPDYE